MAWKVRGNRTLGWATWHPSFVFSYWFDFEIKDSAVGRDRLLLKREEIKLSAGIRFRR